MTSLIEKLRQYRIKNIALFDLISAFLGMIILGVIYAKFTGDNIIKVVIIFILLTIPVGILTHYVLNIKTTLNTYLGL